MSRDDAFERVDGRADAPLLLTCEHASERLPDGWQWPAEDARLRGSHWAFDPGARELTLELAGQLECCAVLSRFTRLLVDPNRDEGHPDLFRVQAEGAPVALNAQLHPDDAERRLAGYYRPYHAAVDAAVAASEAPTLLSLHTFTPVYEGAVRDVQLGVLFNDDEALGQALLTHLSAQLPEVRANEPWSGKVGLMYSVERPARAHGRRAVELEVRHDLAQDPDYRHRLLALVAAFFAGG